MLLGQAGADWVGVSGDNNQLAGNEGDDFVARQAAMAATHAGDRCAFHAGYGIDAIGLARHGGGGTDLVDLNGFGLSFATLAPFISTVGGNAVITSTRPPSDHQQRNQRATRNCRRAISSSDPGL
jgi:hypothetical protein